MAKFIGFSAEDMKRIAAAVGMAAGIMLRDAENAKDVKEGLALCDLYGRITAYMSGDDESEK